MVKLNALVLSLLALAFGAVLAYPRVQASPLQPDAAPTPCNTTKACFSQTNHGSGSALKGVSLATKLGAFGSGAVLAQSDGAGGIYAFSKQFYGGEFESGAGNGTYALIAATDSTTGVAFIAEGPTGRAYVDASGNEYAPNYFLVSTPSADRAVAAYTAAETRASIEDTGTAQLTNGTGVVRFDAAFSRAIDVRNGYQVFLTPDGDVRAPLYVAQKFARGFTVRESERGRSSIFFDYRVVAQRAGSSDVRLPEIREPALPPLAHGN